MGADSSKEGTTPQSAPVTHDRRYTAEISNIFDQAQKGIIAPLREFLKLAPENHHIISQARNPRGRNLLMVTCTVNDPSEYILRMDAEKRKKFDEGRLEIITFLLQSNPQFFDINEVAPALPELNFQYQKNLFLRAYDESRTYAGNDLTALGFACSCKTDTADIVQLLLLEGAEPGVASPSRGITPLMIASAAQFPKAIGELLATNKANPSAADKIAKFSSLHLVCFNGASCFYRREENISDALACAELLVAAGADREAKDQQGFTPLQSALAYPPETSADLVRYFLKCSCEFTSLKQWMFEKFRSSSIGKVPALLGHALCNEYSRRFSVECGLLYSNHASLDASSSSSPVQKLKLAFPSKQTRVHEAILFGSVSVLECILESGCSVDTFAVFKPCTPNGELVEDYVTAQDETDIHQFTPLQLACSLRQLCKDENHYDESVAVDMVRCLLRFGARPDLCLSSSSSNNSSDLHHYASFASFPPLFIAAANRVDSRALMKVLIEDGEANFNLEIASSSYAQNVLEMAVKYNNYFVCDYLVNTLKFNLHLQSPDKQQRLQNLIHVTEANLQNALLERNSPAPSNPPRELIVRPFKPTPKTANYDKTNLKYISLLLPPQTFNQEAVISPLYFNPQLLSIKIENDFNNNSSKLILGAPSPTNELLGLAPEDRARRIAIGSEPPSDSVETSNSKSTQSAIDFVAEFPGVYDGHEEERIRLLMLQRGVSVEPATDSCASKSLTISRSPNRDTEQTCRQHLNAFFSIHDPLVSASKSRLDLYVKKAMEIGYEEASKSLDRRYGAKPPSLLAHADYHYSQLINAKEQPLDRIMRYIKRVAPEKDTPEYVERLNKHLQDKTPDELMGLLCAKYDRPEIVQPPPSTLSLCSNDPILKESFMMYDSNRERNFAKHFPETSSRSFFFNNIHSTFVRFFLREFETLYELYDPMRVPLTRLHIAILFEQNRQVEDSSSYIEGPFNTLNIIKKFYEELRNYEQDWKKKKQNNNVSTNQKQQRETDKMMNSILIPFFEKMAGKPNQFQTLFFNMDKFCSDWWQKAKASPSDLPNSIIQFWIDTHKLNKSTTINKSGTSNYFQRVTRFFEKYQPSKNNPQTIEIILEKYQGKEDRMMQMLVDRYGPEPEQLEETSTTISSSNVISDSTAADSRSEEFKTRLRLIFEKYSPCHLTLFSIEEMMTAIGDYLNEEFLQKLQEKYSQTLLQNKNPPNTFTLENTSNNSNIISEAFRLRIASFPSSTSDDENILLKHSHDELSLLDQCQMTSLTSERENWLPSWRDQRRLQVPAPSYESLFPKPLEAPSARERLIRFYNRYDPSKLPKVDQALEKYKGQEEVLFELLVAKFGPEPVMSNSASSGGAIASSTSSPATPEEAKRLFILYYSKYKPEGLSNLDNVMEKYKGNEDLLIKALENKYGPPPTEVQKVGSSSSSSSSDLKRRVQAIFAKYAPEKVALVDILLSRHGGKEDILLAALTKKYGPEPVDSLGDDLVAAPSPSSSSAAVTVSTSDYKSRVKGILGKYAHEILPQADALLSKYVGYEDKLLQLLVKQYGPEPSSNGSTFSDSSARIKSMIAKYAPEKLSSLDALLTKYAGRENVLLESLKSNFGPEPTPAALSFKDRLTAFYSKYEPAKVSMVDTIVAKFAGKEEETFAQLVRKYGPEPNASEAALTSNNSLPTAITMTSILRIFEQYYPSHLDDLRNRLLAKDYKGKEDELYNLLLQKLGISSHSSNAPLPCTVYFGSPLSLNERIRKLAEAYSENDAVAILFGSDGTDAIERVMEKLKKGGEELRSKTEGVLVQVRSDALCEEEMKEEIAFDDDTTNNNKKNVNPDDVTIAFICVKFGLSEIEPDIKQLHDFILPQREYICRDGVILDAKIITSERLDEKDKLSVHNCSPIVDNLIIPVSILIRTNNDEEGKSNNSIRSQQPFLFERKVHFLCAQKQQQQQPNNNKNQPALGDLTSEFSL